MFARLKRQVEQYPRVALVYRTLRDAWRLQRAEFQSTPLGFRLKGHAAMAAGLFEPEETATIRTLLDTADVFVDVGANIGLYSCLARYAGKRVVAIEPLPDNLDYLFANLRGNGWDDVEVWPVGLADRNGIAELVGARTGASLVPGWAGVSPLLRRPIAVSTLDAVLGSRFEGMRLLIKVDVEGAEARLLAGASVTLRAAPSPSWLVEVNLTEHHPGSFNLRFLETFEIFWAAGYAARTADRQPRLIQPADVAAWVADPRTAPPGGNYVFLKP